MAIFNVTVDDSSPLISYSPAGTWTDSPMSDLYTQKSSHTASSPGASATIKFNGTGIWVFGANKPGYGTYNISVDGQSVSGNAQSQTASFQQLLGGRSGLGNGPHTAVLTNTGSGSAVDLDSIIFETQIGSAGATVTNTTTHVMSTATNAFGPSLKGYFSTSQHFTQLGSLQVPFTFNGDAVAVYGAVSPFHTNYSVTLDGVKHDFLGGSNSLASHWHNGTLLYFANNLTSQSHNLTLTAHPGQPNTGKSMDLDRIVVFAHNGTNSSLSNDISSQPDPVPMAQVPKGNTTDIAVHHLNVPHPSKRLSPVVIKILVAGISIFILVVVLAVVFIRRRRANRMRLRMPSTPNLPLQSPPGISPSESKPESLFYNYSDPEKGIEPPLSAVQPAPHDNPLADDVMQDSRDDRWAPNEGSVVRRSH